MDYLKKSPLISIITVTFNAEKYLEDTIKSVLKQTYKNIEFIIIDGESNDNTKHIINQYSSDISRLISEPDTGIADAMNKGIEIANGEYLLFLHADDYLENSQSIGLATTFMENDYDIFAFNILYKQGNSLSTRKSSWNFLQNFKSKILHQGVLCRKTIFDKIGGFDTNFKIAMDYDFFLRCYRRDLPIKLIHTHTLAVMRSTGISSQTDAISLNSRFYEEKNVHYKNTNPLPFKVIYAVYWFIYPLYRKIIVSIVA